MKRTTTVGVSTGCCSSLKEEEGRLELAPQPSSSKLLKKKKLEKSTLLLLLLSLQWFATV
jgi:hypothetical protein